MKDKIPICLVIDNRYLLKLKNNTDIRIDIFELPVIQDEISKRLGKEAVFVPELTYVIMEGMGQNSYKDLLEKNEFTIIDGDLSHYSPEHFYYPTMKNANKKFFDYETAAIKIAGKIFNLNRVHLAVISDSPYLFPLVCEFVERFTQKDLTIINSKEIISRLYKDYLDRAEESILIVEEIGIIKDDE